MEFEDVVWICLRPGRSYSYGIMFERHDVRRKEKGTKLAKDGGRCVCIHVDRFRAPVSVSMSIRDFFSR